MPNNATVTFNVGSLPQSFNPGGSWQTVLNEFFKAVTAYLPGNYSLFTFGNTTPAVDDQDKPWIRTNVDGSPDRIYVYFNGKWVSPHPITAGGNERKIWVGANDVTLWGYDGGDENDPGSVTPTATTGAMWEIDTAFNDRIPMGVLPSTGQVTSALATAGALTVTLSEANLPAHFHYLFNTQAGTESDTGVNTSDSADRVGDDWFGGNRQYGISGSDAATYPASVGKSSSVGSGTAISIVPPVVGVYFIKRTARVYYVAA